MSNKQHYSFSIRIFSSFSVSAANLRMPSDSRSVAMLSSRPHSPPPPLPFSIQRNVGSSSSMYASSHAQFSAFIASYGSYVSFQPLSPTGSVQSFSCCSRFGAIVSLSQPARPSTSSTLRNDAPITTVFTPFFL